MEFDRTDSAHTERKIQEEPNDLEMGKVVKVHEHTQTDDDSNFECNLILRDEEKERRRVKIMPTRSNEINPPKKGDMVTVGFLDGDTEDPAVLGVLYNTKDRAPVGKSGMWRQKYPSDTSPVGDGNLYVTGYTSYDSPPSDNDKFNLNPEQSVVQIAKHLPDENIDPSTSPDIPFKFEVFDSPTSVDDKMYATIEGNQVDGDSSMGMDVTLDFKEGIVTIRGENSGDIYEIKIDVKNETAQIKGDSNSGYKMGALFNFASDAFKIADGNQFGIKSDGSGNFTWSHKNIDFKEESGSTGSVSL